MRRKMRYFLLFIGLLLGASVFAQTYKWRDIYTVKKKDTVFGIANKYGLSLPELMDANPEMKREGYMLQKGATLFIPYAQGEKNPNKATNSGNKNITTLPAIGGKPVVTSTTAVQSNAVKKAYGGILSWTADGLRDVEAAGHFYRCARLERANRCRHPHHLATGGRQPV